MTRLKASELRIGNLIYDRHNAREGTIMRLNAGEMYPITYSFDKTFECSMPYGTTIEGIVLTEDWLVKFGFEKNREFTSYIIAISPLIKWACRTFIVVAVGRSHHQNGEAWLDLISERLGKDYPELQTCNIPCQYVHQLQNLYFALTGNELEIKL